MTGEGAGSTPSNSRARDRTIPRPSDAEPLLDLGEGAAAGSGALAAVELGVGGVRLLAKHAYPRARRAAASSMSLSRSSMAAMANASTACLRSGEPARESERSRTSK